MSKLIESIPVDFDVSFVRESESLTEPQIRREGRIVLFPALIRQESRTEGDTTVTVYKYFDVEIPWRCQTLTDYDQCKYQCYAELRKFFYGDWTVQNEQNLKGTFAKHQYAVKTTFPKYAGEVLPEVTRFNTIKAEFWALIDEVLTKLGKTRADLPPQPFNAETMLAWATEQGMSAADQASYATKFIAVSTNLLHNGRNWNELF